MTRLLYRLMTMVISVLSGMLAAAIFKRVWRLAAGEEEAPAATDVRATAEGTRKLTGVWPGDDSQQEKAEEQA
jgi:Protein of unknown function (DUF4235)